LDYARGDYLCIDGHTAATKQGADACGLFSEAFADRNLGVDGRVGSRVTYGTDRR